MRARSSSSHLISSELGESCDPGVTIWMYPCANAFRTSLSASSATADRLLISVGFENPDVRERKRTLVGFFGALLALGVVSVHTRAEIINPTLDRQLAPDDLDQVLTTKHPFLPQHLDHLPQLRTALPLGRHLDIHPAPQPAFNRVVVQLVQFGEAASDFGFGMEEEAVGREDEEGRVHEGRRQGGQLGELGERQGASEQQDARDFLCRAQSGQGAVRSGGTLSKGDSLRLLPRIAGRRHAVASVTAPFQTA